MILRPATWEDGQRLLEWRNDPVTIRSLPGAQPTLKEEHDRWVRERIEQPHFYVVEENNLALGTVRLDPCYVISITIAPVNRGRGWAVPVITAAVQRTALPVLAQVLFNNQASIRAFLNAGFILQDGQWYKK